MADPGSTSWVSARRPPTAAAARGPGLAAVGPSAREAERAAGDGGLLAGTAGWRGGWGVGAGVRDLPTRLEPVTFPALRRAPRDASLSPAVSEAVQGATPEWHIWRG